MGGDSGKKGWTRGDEGRKAGGRGKGEAEEKVREEKSRPHGHF